MRYRQGVWWLLGLILALIGGCQMTTINAAASYTIKPFRMNVDVTRRGDANVTETMTYHFDDDYHGVYNVQDLRGIQGGRLTGVSTRLNDGGMRPARAVDSGDSRYQVSQSNQRLKVKVYRAVSAGDRLQVTYRFHLTGVVTNYADTAELNWKLIGAGWDEPLHNVRLTIQLPTQPVKQLQAWTHGPLTGHTAVQSKTGRVVMTIPENPANTFVESHLLFPTQVTAANPNTRAQKRRAAAQKQEAKLAADANAKRQQQRWLVVGGYVALTVGLVALLAGSYHWMRHHPANRYPHPIPVDHFFDVPGVAPAVAVALLNFRSPDTDALSGELMMAASRHEIKLEPVREKKHDTVRLTKTGTVTNIFLQRAFERLGSLDSFTLRDLKQFAKKDKGSRVSHWFKEWQDQVDEAAEVYQDGDNIAIRQRLLGIAWGLTLVIAAWIGVSALVDPLVFKLSAGLGLVVLFGSWTYISRQRRQIDRNTAEGLVLRNEIGGFRRMLKDIGHFNTAKIGDLILWEQILPYAAAFGLAKQVADKLAIDFGKDVVAGALVAYPLYYPGAFNLSLGDMVQTSIAGAIDTSANFSSPSGGSGGFSGGSSGGFGGGSGGGAF